MHANKIMLATIPSTVCQSRFIMDILYHLCTQKIYEPAYGTIIRESPICNENDSVRLENKHAPVAQLVEQLAFNEKVAGSFPAGRT